MPDEYVKPEMNARVTFLTGEPPKTDKVEEKLYIIPRSAVIERDGGKTVLVVSNGTVQAKPISVSREVGNDVHVVNGLTGNESIIIGDNVKQLKVGDRVEVGR
jgi:hypothetical protein